MRADNNGGAVCWGRQLGKDCVRWECLRSEVNQAAREPGKVLEKKRHNREQWKGSGETSFVFKTQQGGDGLER